MNTTLTIKKSKQHYTLVEILVVIALMAILMGIGSAGINAVTGKRGLRGGVTMVSSQISLARSVAVSKNSYIALLLPEPFSGKTTSSNDDFKAFFCNQMRLCFVKPTTTDGEFDFAGWIEGYDWIQLPARTCAHPINEQDYATLDSSRPVYSVDTIKNVFVFSSGGLDSTGIVFAPSGRLASYNNVMIQAYTALPNANSDGKPDMRDLGLKFTDNIQGGSSTKLTDTKLPYRRWCVSINKLTGRTEVTYAQPPEK